ncbi:MAG: hypothetical protein WBC73_23360, partial [Phormidesmis sp.]
PILLEQLGGRVDFDDITVAGEEARRTRFEVQGNPAAGGELTVKGEVQPIENTDPAASDSGDRSADSSDQPSFKYAAKLAIQGDKAPLADVLSFTLSTINLPTNQVSIESGVVSGTTDIEIRPGLPVDYAGALAVDNAEINTALLPLPLKNVAGQTRFQGNQWSIDRISSDYGEIESVSAQGLLDFDKGYDLTAAVDDVSVEDFTQTITLALPVPTEGEFDAVAKVVGPLKSPEVLGTVTANRPLSVDKLTFTSASSDFRLQGQQLYLEDIAATPNTGGSLRGSGQVRIGQGSPFTFNLAGRSLPAKEIAQLYGIEPTVKLGLVAADATVVGSSGKVTTTVDWRAPTAQYPGSGVIDIEGRAIAFRDTRFSVGGGTVSGSGNLLNGQWNSDLTLANVDLGALSETLRGDVSGQFQLSGNTADTRLGAIAADGNIAFSNGLATFGPQFDSLSDPLTAQVAWRGEKVEIIQANSDRITANGTITPILDGGFQGLERFDLNLVARDYGINEIPFVTIPDAFSLAGRTDFTGTLTGKPEAPTLRGNVRLADLVVNRLPFNPLLTGSVNYTPDSGLALNVAGGTDKISLALNPNDQSTASGQAGPRFANLSFDIGWRQAFARGQTQGDLLRVEAGNFPLSALNLPPVASIGPLRGTLTSADVDINLANQTLEGDVAIRQLGLGYIGAGQLSGRVRYADSLATLTDGELLLNQNLYTLNGRLALGGPVPVYSANVETQQGDIQNILTALSIYRLEDFRRGINPPEWIEDPLSPSALDVVLDTRTTGDPDAALLDQLRRLAEIQALQAEAAIAEANSPLPPLRELEGPFAGTLQLNGSGTDFNLDFDLAGANWQWGQDYSAEEVVAKGSLTPNVLTLEPVRFSSVIDVPIDPSTDPAITRIGGADGANVGNGSTAVQSTLTPAVQPELAAVNLAGQLVFGDRTERTSNLQATAENLSVGALSDILQLPLDIEGLANASATLGGTLANPQLRGFAALEAATINETPIQTADARFLYQNARLSLTSALTASTPDQPLTLSAQIPYAFNFMEIQPESEDIAVDINVQDEGLALLNIFNQQVAWESGSGQVNLTVGGTLSSPEITGFASLDEAVLTAKILPEPLTNVTGQATFSGDRIIVNTLQGRFSDGQLTAAGTFPLLYPIISGAQLSALAAPPIPTAAVTDARLPSPTTSPVSSPPAVPPPTPVVEPPAINDDSADPLFRQPLAANLPLTVNLQGIDLNLEGLYSGGVNGQVILGGSALLSGPQITGQVILSNGQVLLSNGNGNGDLSSNDSPGTIGPAIGAPEDGIAPSFRDLRLTLGDAIRVVQGNLLNFVADGTLLINGPPTDLEPDGIISLRSGRVSLYTTIFRLSGRDNTATFTPEMGLQNPFLDVSLRASVPEVDRPGPIASTPFATADIADTSNTSFDNPGSLRTIRVRADVEGPANAIFENLELSSSPQRDQAELIGLIGGGFITALESTVGSLSGEGDSFGGLINLVSGTVLTTIQDFVGNSLSLSEFRLFPVTAASRTLPEENSENEGLDVGASIGVDVTDSTSLSVSKILTDNTNPEFGVNYRLTDALTVRSTTNFDDINQVLIEYELRF